MGNTAAWIDKEYVGLPPSSEALIYIATIRLMLRLLASGGQILMTLSVSTEDISGRRSWRDRAASARTLNLERVTLKRLTTLLASSSS